MLLVYAARGVKGLANVSRNPGGVVVALPFCLPTHPARVDQPILCENVTVP
jgi:hypothetical protein